MNSKTEELRESLIAKAKEHWEPNGGFYLTLNSLISAARAEGAEHLHIPSVIVHTSVLDPKK